MNNLVIKGMFMGAVYQLAFIGISSRGAKREIPHLTNKEILSYGAIGAIGGGLGAMAISTMWPNNALLYHAGIIIGMITYDHFLLV